MYTPRAHAFGDPDAMLAHIDAHPLGTWVCAGRDGLIANHIPFFLDRTAGDHGRLLGHVSRANPVWRELEGDTPSVVMFLGPQVYITPGWYPGKREHGKVVPTWNYVTVHAHGHAHAVQDRDWMLGMLNRLTDARESERAEPWKVADAPDDYIERMMRGIVGIEITIERLEGRLKASQDEDHADRLGTVEGLLREQDAESHAMAEVVRRALES